MIIHVNVSFVAIRLSAITLLAYSHRQVCITFVCNFFLGITVLQREIEDNVHDFFFGGGGQRRCIRGDGQTANGSTLIHFYCGG